jgi:hypothetical protein
MGGSGPALFLVKISAVVFGTLSVLVFVMLIVVVASSLLTRPPLGGLSF